MGCAVLIPGKYEWCHVSRWLWQVREVSNSVVYIHCQSVSRESRMGNILEITARRLNYIVASSLLRIVWRLYKMGYWIDNWIYWITQLQCIRFITHYSSLAESSHCIFTHCLSSNIAGSVRLQLCNSSLKTDARPEYSLVTGTVHVTNPLNQLPLAHWRL
jgi:uncharacterized membrane protein